MSERLRLDFLALDRFRLRKPFRDFSIDNYSWGAATREIFRESPRLYTRGPRPFSDTTISGFFRPPK